MRWDEFTAFVAASGEERTLRFTLAKGSPRPLI